MGGTDRGEEEGAHVRNWKQTLQSKEERGKREQERKADSIRRVGEGFWTFLHWQWETLSRMWHKQVWVLKSHSVCHGRKFWGEPWVHTERNSCKSPGKITTFGEKSVLRNMLEVDWTGFGSCWDRQVREQQNGSWGGGDHSLRWGIWGRPNLEINIRTLVLTFYKIFK